MPFTLIRGTFTPKTGVPDGDSVRFQPDDVALMRSIPRVKMKKGAKSVQLRYEGIDAVEKNAMEVFARRSVEANLTRIGAGTAKKNARGYILTRSGDANGRPVCFVFSGNPAEADGTSIHLKTERLKKSVNFQLVRNGFAYPLFYETLFKELREVLDAAYEAARSERLNIIREDKSNAWVRYDPNVGNLPPIFPKLFRRLDTWKQPTLVGFRKHIEETENERVHTLSDDRFIGFEDAIDVSPAGDRFRLLYRPDDMVFRPK